MKKVTFLFFLCFTVFFSCKESELETDGFSIIDEKGVLGNEIGFISQEGEFQKFDNESLGQFILQSLGEDSFDFESVKLNKFYSNEMEEEFYSINFYNTEHTISMALALTYDVEGGYYYVSGSCKCETTACAQSPGCEAESTGSGCRCTYCSGDCKKTTEVKTDQ